MSDIITDLSGVQFQSGGTTIITSPTIVNFSSASFTITIDPTDTTKITISTIRGGTIGCSTTTALSAGTTRYIPFSTASVITTTNGLTRTYLGLTATLSNMRVAGVAAGAGTCAFTLMVSGSASTLTKTLTTSTNWATDVDSVNSVSVTTSDYIYMRIIPASSALNACSITLDFSL